MNINNIFNKLSQLIDPGQIDVPQQPLEESNVTSLLEVLFGIFAAIAVLVISIGALKLILSRGNPQEVSKARDTIIYAAVGLAISLSAFVIVRFVLESI